MVHCLLTEKPTRAAAEAIFAPGIREDDLHLLNFHVSGGSAD